MEQLTLLWKKGINTVLPYWNTVDTVLAPYYNMMSGHIWIPLLACFIFFSFLMISRLNAVERRGFEGTVVGTLVMPYFSGFPNLCFAYLLATTPGMNGGALVMENCLVNNVTNLTLVLAIPTLIWGLDLLKKDKKTGEAHTLNYLSLLLTLVALIFFTVGVWLLGRDGNLSTNDGFMLVGLFLFWQVFHVFDVLKHNTRRRQKIQKRVIFEFAVIAVCAWGILASVEGLLEYVHQNISQGWIRTHLGTLSGLLMVLPNAFPAFYYAGVKRADIAYSSQVGDCHICIPLCIGIYAVFNPLALPAYFESALFILMGAGGGLLLLTAILGRLPKWSGVVLIGLYGYFMFQGIIS